MSESSTFVELGTTGIADSKRILSRPWVVSESPQKTLAVLEEHGFLRKENEIIICNLEKIRDKLNFDFLSDKIWPGSQRKTPEARKVIPTLYYAFRDLPVYSEEDYQRLKKGESVETKPLFYLPEDEEAALSPERIKQSQFYLGLWELKGTLPSYYPTQKDGWDSKLSIYEAVVACLVFHPQFGNGQRNLEGKLMVNFPEIRDKRRFRPVGRYPLTGEFFESMGYLGSPQKYATRSLLRGHPAEFLLKFCPNLVERRLIKPLEDLRIKQTAERIGSGAKSPTRRGLVMIDGIRYTLGSEYEGKRGYLVYQLSPNLAAIVKHQGENYQLERVFKLSKELPLETRTYKGGGGQRFPYLRKGQIEFFAPAEAEKLAPYSANIVANFEQFLTFSQEVQKTAAINLARLSLKEQGYATAIYLENKNNPQFWKFLKRYQLDGLRSLMLTEVSSSSLVSTGSILEIGEKPEIAKGLFKEVAKILSLVSAYENIIKEKLDETAQKKADKAAEVILQQSYRLLFSALPLIRGEERSFSLVDIAFALRLFREQVELMYLKQYDFGIDDPQYQQLLEVFSQERTAEEERTMALALLRHFWQEQARREKRSLDSVYQETDRFYDKYEEMNRQVDGTTGDTEKQLELLREFLKQQETSGITLDVGCGNCERITIPMAEMVKGSIIALDRQDLKEEQRAKLPPKIKFIQADLGHILLPDETVDLITANWSVINDLLTRPQQESAFRELARVLKKGGKFYLDVPHLEGGEGSWENEAKEYKKNHPGSLYGTIRVTFPGGFTKEFYIYPEKELKALLEGAGFGNIKSLYWQTRSGKPRISLTAELVHKITPVLV